MVESGILESYLMRSRTTMSYFQFVDDTGFSSKACMEDLQNLKPILLVFGCILGLKINLDKNALFIINMSWITRLALMFECKVFITLYLLWVSH